MLKHVVVKEITAYCSARSFTHRFAVAEHLACRWQSDSDLSITFEPCDLSEPERKGDQDNMGALVTQKPEVQFDPPVVFMVD